MFDAQRVGQGSASEMTDGWGRREGSFELELVNHVVEEVRLSYCDASETGVVDVDLWKGLSVYYEGEGGRKRRTTWTWKWSAPRRGSARRRSEGGTRLTVGRLVVDEKPQLPLVDAVLVHGHLLRIVADLAQ